MEIPITLTPILKKPYEGSVSSSKPQRVSFKIPCEDAENIIDYLKEASLDETYVKINSFMKLILSPETEDSILVNWLKQLKDNIFFLDKGNERIVAALLKLDWTSRGDAVASSYQELMLNLVSAHTYYLTAVLNMIIQVFSTVDDKDGFASDEENKRFKLGHKLLQNVISLCPKSPLELCQLLANRFPYVKRPSHMIVCYFVNMLHICTYLPSHRLTILECIIDNMLHVDVHCPKNKIEMFELEREEQEQLAMEPDSNRTKILIEEGENSMAYPLANTMDLLMQSCLNFVKSTCYSNGDELNWEVTKKLFRELLTVFNQLVLPTYACSHVQFIMFYICSLKPALCEGFFDYLWKKVQNPNSAQILRQVSALYIGSLLARATFITITTVTTCLDLMCTWIHSYINNQDTRNWGDAGVHGTFHSVCQAIFYVFAFRHKELIEMKNSLKYLRSLNFERIVTCRLNPLKFCQPTIVQNFASVARNYQIAYCYHVIERNNRSLMSSDFQANSSGGIYAPALNAFFPFDPCLLKRTKKLIDPLYRIYDTTRDEEEPMEEEEDSFEDADTSINNSLFTYSSSPGFKQGHLTSKIR